VGLGPACLVDFSTPPQDGGGLCGNGWLDPDESCDSSDLGGETCRSLGHRGGSLGCTTECAYELEGCDLWHPGWDYRIPITIGNSGDTVDSTDVLVEIDTAALIQVEKIQPDCADLRFLEQDNVTEVDYFIEAGCGAQDSQIWVHVEDIPNGGKTIWMYYGNSTALPGDDWTGEFITLDLQDCPGDWETADQLNSNRFIRGNIVYGTEDGTNFHTHGTVTGETCDVSGNNVLSNGLNQYVGTHRHSFTLEFQDATHLPPYLDVVFCRSRDLTFWPDQIALFDTNDTGDWDLVTELDGFFPRGAESPGGTGGGLTHKHSYPSTMTQPSTQTAQTDCLEWGDRIVELNHFHRIIGGETESAFNLPPHWNVVFASAPYLGHTLPGIIVAATDWPPYGWREFEPLTGRFPRGSATPGEPQGLLAEHHRHTISATTSEASQIDHYCTIESSNNGDAVLLGHKHKIGDTGCLVETDYQSLFPPYVTVLFVQRQASTLETIVDPSLEEGR
jgi:hypothetical protein